MSLTSFLESSPSVRSFLTERFPKPGDSERAPLRVPPRAEFASWVGTAFDYVLRWRLEATCPLVVGGDSWIAERGAAMLPARSRARRLAAESVERARRRQALHMRTGRLTNGLCESAVEMAMIDPIYRVGRGADYLGRPVPPVVRAEVRELIEIVPPSLLKPWRRCVLNPTFKLASIFDGADADLVVDDMLVEVKTTKHSKVDRDYINQLLAYYLVFLGGGIVGLQSRARIRRLGLYMARQGRLYTWRLSEFGTEAAFRNAARWLIAQAPHPGQR